MIRTKLGIIGGSGLYQFPQLVNATWKTISSPWGNVSDDLLFGTVDDLEVVFTMIGGGAAALLRRRLEAELPADADAAFTACALRLLGVPDDEANAIAGEELAQLGRPETGQS